jgi:hypothetical protein
MAGHSIRLEQKEDRISEVEDEMEIKGKTKKLLVFLKQTLVVCFYRQLKTCKGICKNSPAPLKDQT